MYLCEEKYSYILKLLKILYDHIILGKKKRFEEFLKGFQKGFKVKTF